MCVLALAGVLASLAFPPATPNPAQAEPPAYPLTARLTFSPEAASACISGEDSACVVPVGNRARGEYQNLVGKLFQPVPEGAAANLEIIVVSIATDTASTFDERTVTVTSRVLIAAPTGEIDELRAVARAPAPGRVVGSVADAGLRALDETIARFPHLFAQSEKVARWMVDRGLKGANLSAIRSAYRLTARLALAPEAATACVPDEDSRCVLRIGERALAAYQNAIRRMFLPLAPGDKPDVEITVAAVRAETGPTAGGRNVAVTTRARIAAPDRGEVDEISTWAESPVLAAGDDSIAGAGLRALDASVGTFADAFANSGRVRGWLSTATPKVQATVVVSGDRVGRDLSRQLPVDSRPPRSAWAGFGDLGVGFVDASGGGTAGIVAHLGFEGRWFLLQGMAGRWQTATGTSEDMTVWDLGAEAGPVVRLNPSLELHGGVGIHALLASFEGGFRQAASFQPSFEATAPSVFLALQSSLWSSDKGARLRLGVEFRQFFGAGTNLGGAQGEVSPANTYFGGILGFELPWHPSAKAAER
ncbi:MAG TPA: hypothetical protein VFL36_04880 [Myxococcales bacterium]|nr:hypothetical protein [Myxococcales bacterium]